MPSYTTQSSLSSMPSSLPPLRTLLSRQERAATRLLPVNLSQPAPAGRSGVISILRRSSSFRTSSTQQERAAMRLRPADISSLAARTTGRSVHVSARREDTTQSLPKGTPQSLPTTSQQTTRSFRTSSTRSSTRSSRNATRDLPTTGSIASAAPAARPATVASRPRQVPHTLSAKRKCSSPAVPTSSLGSVKSSSTYSSSDNTARKRVLPTTIVAGPSRAAPGLDTTASLRAERAAKRAERLAASSASGSTREVSASGSDSTLTRAERFKKFAEERNAAKSLVVDAATRKAQRTERMAQRAAELAAEREARTASTDSSRFTRSSRIQTVSSRSQRTAPIVRKEEARPAASAARPVPRPTGRPEVELTDPFVDRTNSTSRSGGKIGTCHTANLEFKERLVAIAAKPLPSSRTTCTVSDRTTGRSGDFFSGRRPSKRREEGRHTVTQLRSILKPSSSVRFEAALKDREELFRAEKREGMYTDLLAPSLKITREKGLPTERVSYINIARGPAAFPPWKVPRGYVRPKTQSVKTVRFAESLESVRYFECDRSNDDLLYYQYEEAGDKRPVSWMTGTMNAPELQRPPRQTMWKSFQLGDRDETAITKFRSGPQRQRVCQVRGFYARQEEEIEDGTRSDLVIVKQFIDGFYGLKMTVRGSKVWSGVVMDENDPIECALPVHSFGTMTDHVEPGVWKFWSEAYRLNNDMPGYSRYQCWLGGNCVKFSFGRRCVCAGAWVRQVGVLGDLKVVKVSRPKFASGSKVMVTESLPPAYGGNGMTVASAVSSDRESIITEATGLASPHPRPYITARGPPENSDADGDKSMSPAKPYLRGRRIETPVGEPASPIRTPSPVGSMSAGENEWYRAIVARAMARARNGL
ncbi:aspartyl aminopeptidase [Pyrenophora seminiperda CCB06]|uniref:Aspartyl aminopeptidase n=1 Tax=Pyrenophora seminiperda CCB06 TaxID=1302712 RepID=A0A3M7M137_9PLEO|nr:aspartyl aminopeptidase [Pyrenophora seminiperda CCB06]